MTSMSELNERPTAGLELTEFSRRHVDGALALFAAEGWQTYTTDPERRYRALTAPGCDARRGRWRRLGGARPAPVRREIRPTSLRSWSARGGGGAGSGACLREELAHAGGIRIDLLSRARDYYLALRADPIPGFRLRQETMACAR